MCQSYAYEARNDEGELVAGHIMAESIDEAGVILGEKGLFVVRLASDRVGRRRTRRDIGHATRKEVAWCITQLSIMIESGLRLDDALEHLANQLTEPRLKNLMKQVGKTVQEGRPLSYALEQYPRSFPMSLTALVRASENSGTMSEVLRRASGYLLKDLRAIKKVRAAVMYPLCMLALCLAICVFLLAFILPRFSTIFADRGAVLPAPTRVLMGISGAITTHWYLVIVCSIVLPLVLWIWGRSSPGRRQWDYLSLNVPILSTIYHGLYLSRSLRAMAIQLNAGVSLVDAIHVVREMINNSYYRCLWSDVDKQIRVGGHLSDPLKASGLIPGPVAHMIASGEQSGRMSHVFSLLAQHIEADFEEAIESMTKFIEPCMILCMGGIVGFIAVAMLLPLFQASTIVAG